MRVWFLKQTNSIDTESSVGANTIVWSREGVIYRITPRRNDEVNDTWMADSGRLLYRQVQAADRLRKPLVNGAEATPAAALTAAAGLLPARRGVPAERTPSSVAVVASARSSVEEQFLARKLAAALGATTHVVGQVGDGDRLLISADRTPNLRGALLTGLITNLPYGAGGSSRGSAAAMVTAPVSRSGLADLARAIDAGAVKTVVAIGEDLLAGGLTPAQLGNVAVVYLGTHANPTSAVARVVLPTATVFEKDGTFVNQQFRIQKFHQAIPLAAGALDDRAALAALIAAVGGGTFPAGIQALWKLLAAELPALGALGFSSLPETGVLLDASAWAGLPFIEGETLHYKGPSRAANSEASKPSTPT